MNETGSITYISAVAVPTDQSTPHRELLTARNAAIALRRLHPEMSRIIGNLIDNIEFRLGTPDDPDLKAASVRLYREIERQLGRAA